MKTNLFKNLAILLLLVGVFYTCTAEDTVANFQVEDNAELATRQHFDMQEWELLYNDHHPLDFAVEFRLNPQVSSRTSDYSIATYTELRALSLMHNATLRPSFPGTKNPVLQQYYTLIIRGSYMSVESREKGESRARYESVIEDFLATGKFDDYVREFGIAYALCANPVSVDDPHFLSTYGWPLRMIDAPCAWTITRGNPNVLIGVVDSEFRTTHEEFRHQFEFVWGQSSANHPHGTMVASVAAARANNGRGIAGVAHNSRIAAHRVVHTVTANGGVVTNSYNLSTAINNLHNAGVRIINVSWSGTGLSRAHVEEITREGTVLVVAAGNTPESRSHWYLADIPGVIIVSSVDRNNMHGPTGHAHNPGVTITAPGRLIMVAGGNSDSHYGLASGTSFAAPFVAGTVALMRSVNPILTPAQIENILRATADPIADGGSFPGQLGAGRLNAFRAVAAAPPTFIVPSSSCGHVTISITNMPPGAIVNWTVRGLVNSSGQTANSTFNLTLTHAGWHTIEGTMNLNGITVPLARRTWNNYVRPSGLPRVVQYFAVAGQHAVVIPCGSDFTVPHFAVQWGGLGSHTYLAGATIHWSGLGQQAQGYGGLEFRPRVYRRDLDNFPTYNGIFVTITHRCGVWRADLPVRLIDGCYLNTGFSYYLNPASDVLIVNINEEAVSSVQSLMSAGSIQSDRSVPDPTFDILLYDSRGNRVRRASSKGGDTEFDVANLPEGIYFLHIFDGVNSTPDIRLIVIER